jgi:organic hydroperoxide reductase OsmC/OhrA
MNKQHHYKAAINWTGNKGEGTGSYQAYDRSHTLNVHHKPEILLSSDPSFRGDTSRYNPEELFLASLSSCHMLWYLHLCADNGIVVTAYTDMATGTMEESESGGKFTEIMLHPHVTVANSSMITRANELHQQAHEKCFIANSCNFPVRHHPVSKVELRTLSGE